MPIDANRYYWRLHCLRGLARLVALWLIAAIPVAIGSSRVWAAPVGQSLETAEGAAGEGRYRAASEALDAVAPEIERLSSADQIKYWTLRADVDLASGQLSEAEQAAARHLALVRRMGLSSGGAMAAAERDSLLRLALAKRAWCEDRTADEASRDDIRRMDEACTLLEAALRLPATEKPADLLRTADARLALAATLDWLGRVDRARTEFTATSNSARSALRAYDGLKSQEKVAPAYLRGVTVIRQSYIAGDKEEAAKQARLAAELIERRLQRTDVARAERVGLLVAAADCSRQLDDSLSEERYLTEALELADRSSRDEKEACAEILVRLAELSDSPSDASRQARAETHYRSAALLYSELWDQLQAGRHSDTSGAGDESVGQESQYLLQLQLIHTRLETWDEAIRAAEHLFELRREATITGKDPNFYRAATALGSLHAKAARAARGQNPEGAPDFSRSRAHVQRAVELLRLATEFWRAYVPKADQDLANSLNYYAEMLRYNGEFRVADELLAQAKPSFQRYGESDVRLGEYYLNRAAVLAALGQYATALNYYDLAGGIGGRAPGTQDVDYRARLRLSSMVYLNKAQLYKSQRQMAAAREMCDQALALSKSATWLAPDAKVEFEIPFQLTDASLRVAEAELIASTNQPTEQARRQQLVSVQSQLLAAARSAARIAADPAVDDLSRTLAKHVEALANFDLARLCGSAEGFRTAKARWREIAAPPDANELPALGVLRTRALNYLAGLALLELNDARAKARIAAAEQNGEQFAAAQRECERLLDEAERHSSESDRLSSALSAYPSARFHVLLTRAKVLQVGARIDAERGNRLREAGSAIEADQIAADGRGKMDLAIKKLGTALDAVELPRAMTVGAEDERAMYFSQFAPAFDLLVELYVDEGRLREAIETAEKRRSRTFLDQRRAGGFDLYATLPSELEQEVLQEKALGDRYFTLLAKVRENPESASVAQLHEAKSAWVKAHYDLISASPAYRELLIKPLADRTAESAERFDDDRSWVSSRIGGDDLALVYYLGANRSYVFACSRSGGIGVYPLEITPAQAGQLGVSRSASTVGSLRMEDARWMVNRVIGGIDFSLLAGARGSGALPEQSARFETSDIALVTEILLPTELRDRIESERPKHVLIVPDGALHQMPFETLTMDKEGKQCVLEALPPIAYAPSLAIYELLRQQPGEGNRYSLLSVANPRYADGLEAGNPANEVSTIGGEFAAICELQQLTKLPETKTESDQVCRAFRESLGESAEVRSLMDDTASETNVREELRRREFTFLHFAVHGLVDQQFQNLFGALALATPTKLGAGDDGFLTLQEILGLRIGKCELAILSACQTNCGPQRPLEAGSTIARSFICAGANRVICSHWSVPDRETAQLVADFMSQVTRELADGGPADYADALRNAKLKLRASGARPKAWAPLVLVGPPTNASPAPRGAEIAARD